MPYDHTKVEAIVKGTDEHFAALKAATDPLAWLLLMHDSEMRVCEATGITPERMPYLECATEIRRLRALTENYLRSTIEEKMLANHPPMKVEPGEVHG